TGKVLGLVGFGTAAAELGQIAQDGLRMHVRAWARRPDKVVAAGYEWESDLDELLRTADVVSVHLALNGGTRGLIDDRRIRLLQPHALLVNTSRAAVIDN